MDIPTLSSPESFKERLDVETSQACEPTNFLRVPNFALHIDMSLKQLLETIGSSLVPWQRSYIEKCLVNTWANTAYEAKDEAVMRDPAFASLLQHIPTPSQDHLVITLSARSALDLWFRVQRFPRGSVVLMSAINIPTMASVVEHHGLVPLPIDLDLDTLEPIGFPQSVADIETCFIGQLVSTLGVVHSSPTQDPQTNWQSHGHASSFNSPTVSMTAASNDEPGRICCILTAHLFGRRHYVDAIATLARHFGLPFVEDLAEAYTDGSYPGHPLAALTLFSFGTIKNSTAFGCGIARVNSTPDFDAMQRLHEHYPSQRRMVFFKKTLKNAAIMALLHTRLGVGVANLSRAVGFDHKAYVVNALRGFPGPLIPSIRAKPSVSQVATLARRLNDTTTTSTNIERSRMCGRFLEQALLELNADVQLVALNAPIREYWLFPILVRHPVTFINRMTTLGVDVYRGATQLAVIPCPHVDLGSLPSTETSIRSTLQILGDFPAPSSADLFMQHVVYLPVNRRCTQDTLLSIAHITRVAAGPAQDLPIVDSSQVKATVVRAYDTCLAKLKLRVIDRHAALVAAMNTTGHDLRSTRDAAQARNASTSMSSLADARSNPVLSAPLGRSYL